MANVLIFSGNFVEIMFYEEILNKLRGNKRKLLEDLTRFSCNKIAKLPIIKF